MKSNSIFHDNQGLFTDLGNDVYNMQSKIGSLSSDMTFNFCHGKAQEMAGNLEALEEYVGDLRALINEALKA